MVDFPYFGFLSYYPLEIKMKEKLVNKKSLGQIAVALIAAAGLVTGAVVAPANAATRTTVVIVTSNALTGLNPSVQNMNLTFNSEVAYLSGMGFNYYDDKPSLIDNKVFGSYKIVSKKPFKVMYTVAAGRVWSDGTPINGVDLLLSHIVSSSTYSVVAGLGDPVDSVEKPAFNSLGYGGTYDEHAVGLPQLSKDKMSVTIEYDAQIPDWQIQGPGPSPVHAIVLLADGKTKLGTAKENEAARARFLKAFDSYQTDLLSKMGKIWSTSYNINKVDASTNPLLLVGNGAYIVTSAVPQQSVTLGLNPKYNSGPKTSGIKTIVFKIIGDGTAAAQALANKEVDIYQGQPTADSVAQLKAIASAKVIGGDQAVYEHIDLRVGPASGTSEPYNGPFAGMGQQAKDLRTAFLMAYPREEIVEKLIKPINSSAVLMNSILVFPKEPGYADMVKNSGVSKYTSGTQAERTAKALALVKKYYPDASATNNPVKIRLLWGQPSNTRRASEAALAKAAVAKAGFDLTAVGTQGWSNFLDSAAYDAEFFAWVKSAVTQKGNADLFSTESGNNLLGYSNKLVDATVKALGSKQYTDKQKLAAYLIVEKQVMEDAITLPIFQHPGVTAVNKLLKNVKPAPLSPQLVWNFWEWKY